ncbi:MAG: tRNA (5-methylaminomethyl-2-thiouridine)(34)-methyltransferase MnmD [Flavobacteriales bacterium]
MYTPPPDFTLLRTADGSATLRSARLGEQYHSVHGAVQESRHVFLRHGLEAVAADPVDVLEVGLGTGLNMLLTWQAAEAGGRTVRYHALEPFPVPLEQLKDLGHAEMLGADHSDAFLRTMTAVPEAWHVVSPWFHFRRSAMPVHDLQAEGIADVVYFDAFGPATQPEMWTLDVMQRMFRALWPGGLLVTYCAKGEVRRTLQAAGFVVERLPGPPGKREMLRAARS